MDLVLVGLNHRTAPVELRERLAFPDEQLPSALRTLSRGFQLREGMIVSTCNRVEILAGGDDREASRTRVIEFLDTYHAVPRSELEHHLYVHWDAALVRHVFRVASSLDSMVLGETQILSQMKVAFARAREAGSVGSALNSLIPRAFFVAKRVRSETRIARSAVSVSSVAVELARKIFGDLSGKGVLLLGSGKMAELAARSLLRTGISRLLIANRTPEKSQELASRFAGTAVPFLELERYLEQADIVLVSTGSDSFVLERKQVEKAIRRRRYSPLFLIDISVPRNVDPAVNEIENVFLYDIDDLQSVISSNLEERQREAELAEEIINEEVENFLRRTSRRQLGSLVGTLRERIEQICLEELEKERRQLPFPDAERVERILRRAAHRIAHPLMMEIKRNPPDRTRRADSQELLRRAFRLDEDP